MSSQSPKKQESGSDCSKTACKVKVTLTRSLLGRPEKHRRVARALGLKKSQQSVFHFDTPIIRGMLEKISHLLTVELA